MPLARIITSNSTECGDLESDLRARGFDIEKVSPDANPTEPADLEISLEEFSVEEVLSHAAEAAQANDVSVFIAPGAIVDSPRPVHVIRLQANVEKEAKPALVEEINLSEIAESPIAEPAATTPVISEPEPVMEEAVPVTEAPSVPSPELEELVSGVEEVVPEIGEVVISEVEGAEPDEIPLDEVDSEDEVIDDEVPELALSVMEDSVMESEDDFVDEPVSDWPIWNPPMDDELAEPVQQNIASTAVAGPTPVEPVRPRTGWVTRVAVIASTEGARLSRDRKLFWRVAAVTGVAAVSVLMFGASWHRRSPLPAQLTPAAGASSTVAPEPAVAPASHVSAEPADQSQATPLPLKQVVARRRMTDYAEEENLIAPDTVVHFDRGDAPRGVKAKPRSARRTRASAASANSIIAKDTVVRYGNGSKGK